MDTTTTTNTAPTKTAKEARIENQAFAHANNLPMVQIRGNSFPCRHVFYAFGGEYDKVAKIWSVPSHKAMEAQMIVNRFTPGTEEHAKANPPKVPVVKAEVVKPAPAATVVKTTPPPAPVKMAEVVKTTKPVAQSNLEARLTALATVSAKLLAEVEATNNDLATRSMKLAIETLQGAAAALRIG
jgi:hypothetical protein